MFTIITTCRSLRRFNEAVPSAEHRPLGARLEANTSLRGTATLDQLVFGFRLLAPSRGDA
jgi:hypothetical protein